MAMDRAVSLAVLLQGHRRRARLSQRELAERAGLSLTTIRDLEQGRTRQPQPPSLRALATALGLDEDHTAALHDAAVVRETACLPPATTQRHGLVRLGLLGPLTLRRGPVEVPLGRGGRRLVLARLALTANVPVPVDELVDLLWGDRPPPDPHQLLQSYISRLRLALDPPGSGRPAEGLLGLGTGGYRLVLSEQQLDLAEFRALVRAAQRCDPPQAVDMLASALRLWRDAPLADVSEMRNHALVTALVQEHVAVALRYADLTSQLGLHERSLPALRALAGAHPLHEPVHARLVTALAGAGLQADALAAYNTIRRRLADDLGIDPGTELIDAHRRVLRQEVTAAGTERVAGRGVPAQLPAGTPGFVGRRDELDRLDRILESGESTRTVVISAVSGMAGVGKTALAVHWARRVAGRFPDGQLYANLRGFEPDGTAATPCEVVRSFLDALDVPAHRVPEGLDAQAALYRSLLAERRMLVLLDNARDADQVRPLLPGTPGCLVLVTSRNQLTGLIAGAGAVPLPLDLLNPDEAADLLARRIGAGRVAAEPRAVEEIVEDCARLPLALAIVAARAATQPRLMLAALAAELRHLHDRLDRLATGDPGTDVRSAFSWSYQQLSGPGARLFRLLGLHPGPDLSAPAAASLAGIPPGRVRPVLAELARAHLITERLPGRYAQHDLLRAYATELAATDEPDADRQAAVRRLLDHYLRSAHGADAAFLDPTRDVIDLIPPLPGVTVDDFGSAAAAGDWFTTEYQVLLAAVRLAVDAGLDRHAWQLVWSMVTFIDHRDFHDAVAVHRIALQAARRLNDLPAQGYSHRRLGLVFVRLGEHDEASAHYEQALEVYRRLGDDTNQAHVHLGLGHMLDRQGRYRDALHQDEQALALYRISGQRAWQATALNNVGCSHRRLGDYEIALTYCQQALSLHQRLGNRRGEADTRDSLGLAYHHLGRHTDAVAAYQQALALFRDLGYRYNQAETLVNLADTYHAGGDNGTARDCWQQALAILIDLGHPDADQVRARLCDSAGDRDREQ
jgi:DNA-binding SARP family transcriptional activator/tetratricopeptide (TPR) repeat protein/DNA-binding XRE family transcriptional regulator